MIDVFSKEKRSQIMSLIKSRDTKPEIIFRKLVSSVAYSLGLRYKKNYGKIIGKPDVVFVGKKLVFFVDGDFWHGYNLKKLESKLPHKFWLPKIKQNITRDRKVDKELKRMGWKVVRFWEHEVLKKHEEVLLKVRRVLL